MAYFVGAYWGPRREPLEACASRVSIFLRRLAQEHVALSSWFRKAASRKTPPIALPNDDPDGIASMLRANRFDTTGEVIAELGFNLSAWTGSESDIIASLAVTCGAFSPAIRNAIVLSFDSATPPTSDLLQAILKVAVISFDPEDAVASTTESLLAHPSLPAWEIPTELRYRRGSGFSTD